MQTWRTMRSHETKFDSAWDGVPLSVSLFDSCLVIRSSGTASIQCERQ